MKQVFWLGTTPRKLTFVRHIVAKGLWNLDRIAVMILLPFVPIGVCPCLALFLSQVVFCLFQSHFGIGKPFK